MADHSHADSAPDGRQAEEADDEPTTAPAATPRTGARDQPSPSESSHPPTTPCALLALARVEVQAIMHFLDRGDLSRLARCSRRVYADADEKAAWKHVTPRLVINESTLDRGLVEAIRIDGLFFRHRSPTAASCKLVRAVDVAAAVALCSLRHIVDLTLDINMVDPFPIEQWREFFDQLPLDNLLVLVLVGGRGSTELAESMADWMSRLTRLHRLVLAVEWPSAPEHIQVATQAICAMPNLIGLFVRLPHESARKAVVLMRLVDCAHLTRLATVGLPMDSTLLQQFIIHLKSAPQLRQLVIGDSSGSAPPSGDYSSVFAAMPQLEELALHRFVTPPVALLQHAHHAASLRLIEFRWMPMTSDMIESIRQVHAATHSAVHLRVVLLPNAPVEVVQALVAIDPKRITCQLQAE